MPKITDIQIQKNNKTRANVYIDNEFAFGLEMLTVMKLGLKIGAEVSQERLDEAVFDSEKTVAFDKAMGYLSRSMKTVKQMKDYLTKKGFTHKVVEYVIDKLQDYKYLNDEQYAKTYVEQASANKGNRRIKQELMQKGISQQKAEQFKIDDETASATAEKLGEKYMRNKTPDLKTLQKLQRYLLSRGYDFDVVNAVIRKYGKDNDD